MSITTKSVVAPLAVTAVDIVVEKSMPQYSDWAKYIMAGGGYLAAQFMGGNMADWGLSVGMSALPLAAKLLYNKFVAPAVPAMAHSVTMRNVSRGVGSVSRSYQPEFNQAGAF